MIDRIELAKAMGWTDIAVRHGVSDGGATTALMAKPPMGSYCEWHVRNDGDFALLLDPEHDASDDYVVLEWMRENWQGKEGQHAKWHQIAKDIWWVWDEYAVEIPYKIGDYARAALKVIQGDG